VGGVFGRFASRLGLGFRRETLRRPFIVALLFAFLAQAQVVASHIHAALPESGKPALAGTTGGLGAAQNPHQDQKKSPADDCPLCQQIGSAHSFLAPVAVALRLPEATADRPALTAATLVVGAKPALNWQSRAPPV
jgi:hypothetical protein